MREVVEGLTVAGRRSPTGARNVVYLADDADEPVADHTAPPCLAARPRRLMSWHRRTWLQAMALAPGLLTGCGRTPRFDGGWVGAAHERGHAIVRDGPPAATSATPVLRRASVLVIGAGVAGLACARHLVRQGMDDVQVLELEDQPGGNSRAHEIAGMPCPLGAHYLPVPGPEAEEVIELLEAWGLRRRGANGRIAYDERHLCHSPQERLWIDGGWHEGLLPPVEALPAAERAATLAQYQRFSRRVDALGRAPAAFTMPTPRCTWSDALSALDAVPFSQWLDAEGFDAPALRWYLDYCCHDDYGAGSAQVSAWAGVHYFASRHGFWAPGSDAPPREAVLTWPEGNAWLARRLAEPLAGRLHTGRASWRVAPGRHGVEVDCWDSAGARHERWQAAQVVLATPLFISARLLGGDASAVAQALRALQPVMRHAPWLVANLHLAEPLVWQPGAAPSWDNLVYDPHPVPSASPGRPLGWVDATHQRLRPDPGPTVLTAYWALGGQDATQLRAGRERLLKESWAVWAQRALAEPARVHPDLPAKVRRIDLMRHGHAMCIPLPGLRRHPALQALGRTSENDGRVHVAHADLSTYSVFEEAVYWGVHAARAALARFEPRRR